MNTPEISDLEALLNAAKATAAFCKAQTAQAEQRIVKLEYDIAEARKPKPLVVQTSWTICGPARTVIEPQFDGSGDLCIAVTERTGADLDYTARTFVNRDGARAIIDHLTRALSL